ncbi:MAG: hypothetical protein ACR2HF_12345 [Methylococcaceae bacterium]
MIALNELYEDTTASPILRRMACGMNNVNKFGHSVAVASNGPNPMVVVGAPGYMGDTGRIYVYRHDGRQWVDVTPKGIMLGTADGGQFGYSVAIASNGIDYIVAAGSSQFEGGEGKVCIYCYDGIEWSDITPGEGLFLYDLGSSIAIAANGTEYAIVIGAPGTNHYRGKVYVFRCRNRVWTPITPEDMMAGTVDRDQLGYSTAITAVGSGYVIAVGAPGFNGGRGKVNIYQYDRGVWTDGTPKEELVGVSVDDRFGYSIAITAEGIDYAVIIGAPGFNAGKGKAYVYRHTAAGWTAMMPDGMPGGQIGDRLGDSVAMITEGLHYHAIIGAPGTDEGRGRVYVYRYNGITWIDNTPSCGMVGETIDCQYGHSVAVVSTALGTQVVVGAPRFDNKRGKAYLYK